MPNVLILGGPLKLYQQLRGDSRWKVLRGVPDDSAQRDERLPDPRRQNLILDDRERYGGAHDDDSLVHIPGGYLSEVERGHLIRFASHIDQVAPTVSTSGYRDLEFHPTTEPEAELLADFVQEFQGSFERVHLHIDAYRLAMKLQGTYRRTPFRPLYLDSYDNPLIVMGEFRPRVLYIIDLPDDDRRVEAFKYLCYRTVPRLWPDVYSDHFMPRRVVELERQRARIVHEHREQLKRLDAEADEERRFYADYAPLTELADDALKNLVHKVFQDVLGCQVTDLDKGLAEGEPKTLDLLIVHENWRAFVEVRGSNRGCRKSDLEKMDNHLPRAVQRHGVVDSKIFVFNGLYWRDRAERTEDALFGLDVIEEAQAREISLLSTFRLLEAIERHRNGETTTEEIVGTLKMPGLFEPPWHNGNGLD